MKRFKGYKRGYLQSHEEGKDMEMQSKKEMKAAILPYCGHRSLHCSVRKLEGTRT